MIRDDITSGNVWPDDEDNGVLWDDPDSPEARRCLAELKQLNADLASEREGSGFSGPALPAGVPDSVRSPLSGQSGPPAIRVVEDSDQGGGVIAASEE